MTEIEKATRVIASELRSIQDGGTEVVHTMPDGSKYTLSDALEQVLEALQEKAERDILYTVEAATPNTDEIRKRCKYARPGPWIVRNDNDGTDYMPFWVISDSEEPDEWFAELHVGYREDAEFIAHARQDIPFLLSEVDRLRKALDAKDTNVPTNFDRITASKGALAEFMRKMPISIMHGNDFPCEGCADIGFLNCCGDRCKERILAWLEQTAETGGEAE